MQVTVNELGALKIAGWVPVCTLMFNPFEPEANAAAGEDVK